MGEAEVKSEVRHKGWSQGCRSLKSGTRSVDHWGRDGEPLGASENRTGLVKELCLGRVFLAFWFRGKLSWLGE